jgi:hypothetical protein
MDRVVGFEPTTSAMPNCIFSGFGLGGKSKNDNRNDKKN